MARKIGLSTATLHKAMRWSFALWIIALAIGGLVLAYINVLDPMMLLLAFIVFSHYAWASAPAGLVMAVIPLIAVTGAAQSVWRARYWQAAALIAVPLLGAAGSFGTYKAFVSVFTGEKLLGYEMQIDEARRLGKDVEAPNLSIKLGPPVTARFRQTGGMSWNEITFIGYDESDGMADPKNLNTACEERSRPLGGHFFFIDTGC